MDLQRQIFNFINKQRRSRKFSFFPKIVGYTSKSTYFFDDPENIYAKEKEFRKALELFTPLTRGPTYYISLWNTKSNCGPYSDDDSNVSHMTVVVHKWMDGIPTEALFYNPMETGGNFLVSWLYAAGFFTRRSLYLIYGDQKDDEMDCAERCLEWVKEFVEKEDHFCDMKFNKNKNCGEICNTHNFW